MAVKEIQPSYGTSDGGEFATREEAEKHEALVEAERAYHEAEQRYARALAENTTTKDGHNFSFAGWGGYYRITLGIHQMPQIMRLSVYPNDIELQRDGRIQVRYGDPGKNEKPWRIEINELYRDEANAKKALLEAQEQWIKDQQETVDRLRGEVEKMR